MISLSTSGCFIPGGGWTMRTGVDWRRHGKPAAFVELVDTRWDEYNRVAEINTLTATMPAPAVVAPPAFTPAAGPHLMEGVAFPPASDPEPSPSSSVPPEARIPGNLRGSDPSGGDSTADEPSRLPGSADSPDQPPVLRDLPTAGRSAIDGPSKAESTGENATTDATDAASAQSQPAKFSRRPIASRLFSRPR